MMTPYELEIIAKKAAIFATLKNYNDEMMKYGEYTIGFYVSNQYYGERWMKVFKNGDEDLMITLTFEYTGNILSFGIQEKEDHIKTYEEILEILQKKYQPIDYALAKGLSFKEINELVKKGQKK